MTPSLAFRLVWIVGCLPLLAPSPAHAVLQVDHTRAIEVERTIEAPVAEVWDAWTTDEGLESFMAPQARVELRVGGAFETYFLPGEPTGLRGAEGCRVLSYAPEHMLSFSWSAPPRLPDARRRFTHVVLTLEPAGEDRTRLTLRHLGWPQPAGESASDLATQMDAAFDYFSNAWPMVMDACARRFTEGPRDFGDPAEASPAPPVAQDRPNSFSVERVLPAPPETVWAWLTEEEKVEQWMAAKADVQFRIDGEFRTSYNPNSTLNDDDTIVNRILAYEPNRMLAMRNVRAPRALPFDVFQDTWSVMYLEPTPDGRTKLISPASATARAGSGSSSKHSSGAAMRSCWRCSRTRWARSVRTR